MFVKMIGIESEVGTWKHRISENKKYHVWCGVFCSNEGDKAERGRVALVLEAAGRGKGQRWVTGHYSSRWFKLNMRSVFIALKTCFGNNDLNTSLSPFLV